MGSSTEKTEKDILYTDNIEDIRNNIKINIFASGTSDKTKKFYKIKNVYEWEIEDEGYMKELNNDISSDEKDEIVSIMKNRHGNEFIETINDNTLNKNYSKYPTQVLMKHSIPKKLIDDIKEYNTKNNSNYGYSCNSLFALNKVKTKSNKYEYENKFELENSSDGIEILKSFFECIISGNKMNKTTIMKLIEETQSSRKSRISKKGDAKLFIMYLPIHTGNNNILQLQKTFTRFIKDNKLWTDYNIEYSNSIEDSNASKEEYNDYIQTIINKSNKDNKKGCILLLGNKGGVGITYYDCDTTISLDDGHNLDNQKQRYSRALTEAENKTIGINVDMNIQRTYLYLNDIIHKHKRITKTTKTNGEIIKYLYDHNIFLFNPSEISNGKISSFDITSYYNKEAENILLNIDDTELLNNIIVCDDDIIGDDEVEIQFSWNDKTNQLETKIINPELEGEQQDCPKGEEIKKYIEDNNTNNSDDESKEHSEKSDDESEEITKVEEDKREKHKQILKEVCKRVLFPLLSLLSRTYQQLEFKDMMFHSKTKEIINSILKDKKILLNKNSYNSIIRIMDNNNEIINNIREIYRTSSSNKIHQLIAKHFIPSVEERKNNAEIPTPIILVEEMLDTIPTIFWETPHKVFEPCCGKGNFVMKIFEKFYNGLKKLYPDENIRCKIIITECLYYADLTTMNIFITTEILKCEVQSKTGLEDIDYFFNYSIGNTLELNILTKWNIINFDAIIGNPPYEDIDATGDNKLYLSFIKYSLEILKNDGLLLFITPTNVKNYLTCQNKNRGYINNLYNIKFLSINTSNIYFPKVGTFFAYFLIEKQIVNETKTNVIFIRNGKIESDIITIKKGYNLPLCISKNDLSIINKVSNLIENKNILFDIKKASYNINNKLTFQRIRTQHIKTGKIMKKKTDNYKYKIIDKINKTNPFPGIYYYNNVKMCDYEIPKIIMCTGGYLMPEYDQEGEYNLSDNMIYMLCKSKESYESFKNIVNSNLINYLNKITMTDNIHGRDNVIMNLKKIDLNNINNDKDIYKIYNITEEEQQIIELTLNKIIKNVDENHIENKIIKDGRKQYYLIKNKLYKVKKDKSHGVLFGTYIDGKIEKIKIDKKPIKKPSKKDNDELNDKPIIEVKKKKSIVKKS
jgi:hypothetical protein